MRIFEITSDFTPEQLTNLDNMIDQRFSSKKNKDIFERWSNGSLSLWTNINDIRVFYLTIDDEPIGYISGYMEGYDFCISMSFIKGQYRGSGYGYIMYSWILDLGFNLVSDFKQSSLSQNIWTKLRKNYKVDEYGDGRIIAQTLNSPQGL